MTNLPLVSPGGMSHSAENDEEKIENFQNGKMYIVAFRNWICWFYSKPNVMCAIIWMLKSYKICWKMRK